MEQKMMIGKVAKLSGLGIETIRFYERRGLLSPTARRESGYREYNEESLDRLTFIKKAKDLGFNLDEIAELLSIKVSKKNQCKTVEGKASKKLYSIRSKIADLKKIETVLEGLIKCCKNKETTDECPILDCLDGRAQ